MAKKEKQMCENILHTGGVEVQPKKSNSKRYYEYAILNIAVQCCVTCIYKYTRYSRILTVRSHLFICVL